MKSSITARAADTCYRTVLFVSGWNVLIAFVEATVWHFTDPLSLGFSVWPLAVFMFAVCLPAAFCAFKPVRSVRPNRAALLAFSLFEPALLSVVASPALDELPTARTGLLAAGTFALPFQAWWLWPNIGAGADFGAELYAAVFFTMSARWCSASVNVFYEDWPLPCALLAVTAVLAGARYAAGAEDAAAPSSKGGGEKQAAPAGSSHQDRVVFPTSGDSCSNETMYDFRDSSSLAVGCCKPAPASGKPLRSRRPSGARMLIWWLCAVTSGPGVGAAAILFLALFNSPAPLTRWAGLEPRSYGVVLLACAGVGAVLALLAPALVGRLLRRGAKASCKNCKGKTTKANARAKNVAVPVVAISALHAVVLFASTFMILRGAYPAHEAVSFTGACLLCCAAPGAFALIAAGTGAALTGAARHNGVLAPLTGVAHFLAALSFCLVQGALMLFVTPTFTTALLGRMDIILPAQVACICLALPCALTSIATRPRRAPRAVAADDVKRAPNVEHVTRFVVALLTFVVCAAVAGARVPPMTECRLPEPADAGADAAPDNRTLRVMSWNLLFGHTMQGRDNTACVTRALARLRPDVLGVQESDALPAHFGGKDLLGSLELGLARTVRTYRGVRPLRSSIGVGLLSSARMAAAVTHAAELLPVQPGLTLPHYSYTRTVFRLPAGKRLHVINVHAVFRNWTIAPNLHRLSELHLQHVAALAGDVEPLAPLLVIGDFNLNPGERELNPLFAAANLTCAVHPSRRPLPASSLLNRYANVDHIFYRNLEPLGAGAILEEVGPISDHYPVLAEFRMPE